MKRIANCGIRHVGFFHTFSISFIIMKAGFDRLLEFQTLEMHQLELQRSLDGLPREREDLERKLVSAREKLDEQLAGFKSLELKQKTCEGDRAEQDNIVRRLRTQLLEVKKNDQYQAMNREIDDHVAQISRLEEEEIETMMLMDEERPIVKAAEIAFNEREKELKGMVNALETRKTELEKNLSELAKTVADTESSVDPGWMKAYKQVKNQVNKGPWVVQLVSGQCKGCHLRVSNEVAGNFGPDVSINHCDQCGRILYRG
jgi:predicted  nucleic acid-binding Zn-ribbon protein